MRPCPEVNPGGMQVNSQESGESERGLMCLSDAAQQPEKEYLHKRAPKDNSGFKEFYSPRVCLIYGWQMLGAVLWGIKSRLIPND